MDIKKILLAGSCVATMMMAACGDDSSASAPEQNPENPALSSGADPLSSGGGDAPASSSSSQVPRSSSVDANVTYMAITEIMYNAPAQINGVDAAELEWVELTIASGKKIYNMAHETVQLRLDGAIQYAFPAEPLDVGEYIVVTNNVELFKAAYPDFTGRVFGPWDNDATGKVARLSNEGDVIDVRIKGEGDNSCSYSKEPPWPSLANGKGHTLVFKGGNAAQSASWGASKLVYGNPGAKDEWLEPSTVRINEMKPYASDADPAWVELYNYGTADVDVSGWSFESKVRKETLKIAAGIVPAGGYLVLNGAADFVDETGAPKELIVSAIGGEYYLRGLLEGDESSLMLPSSQLTSGIVDLKDGSIAQGALVEATPGAANAALYVGSVVINEINYHPADEDAKQIEFLEIKNIGAIDVKLSETVSGVAKGWKIEGINFEFAATDVLPAGAIMVLFPAEAFTTLGEAGIRANYGIDETVQIRSYSGKLSNRGENIAIKKPFSMAQNTDGSIQWYYEWSDAVLYSDGWEGMKQTDGYGMSMHRVDYTTMGHEASAWKSDVPSPGK